MDAEQLKTVAIALGALSLPALYMLLKPKASIPGPPGLPLIGNALDFPMVEPWLVWEKWRKQYGPIVCLEIFKVKIVMLNEPRLITEMLDKTPASSGRAIFYVLGELVGWENSTAGLQPGPRHREARRAFHETIGKQVLHRYSELIERKIRKLAVNLLESQGEKALVPEYIKHAIAGITVKVTYGIDIADKNDPIMADAQITINQFNENTKPGSQMVEFFPFLKYVPGMRYKRMVPQWRKEVNKVLEAPANIVMDELRQGIVKQTVAHELLQEPNMSPERLSDIQWMLASIYFGGIDTTANSINSAVLAMALYPEVQKKARDEIERVLGKDQLPTAKDRKSLPYIDAFIKEVTRWHPIVANGGPRRLTEDTILEGYVLPKETIVLSNLWGICHDDRFFSSPHEFLPERFLESDDPNAPTALYEPWNIVFGAGRRVCPGRDLADLEIWYAVATIFATLHIELAPGEHKTAAFLSGTISGPEEFSFVITPLSPTIERVLRYSIGD